ncbi:MAG: hypothetical protein ABI995_05685 [Acidobacteriota bacterium]
MRTLFALVAMTTGTLVAQPNVPEADEPVKSPPTLAATNNSSAPQPFTLAARYKWVLNGSTGAKTIGGYLFSSALSTGRNAPPEYGPHWDGYAKRIGLKISTGATGRMLEASIGALWGEDPRYEKASGRPLTHRLWNIARMSVLARNRRGELVPAYARYIAVPANSFVSNAWRPDSETTVRDSTVRIPLSFLDRVIANTFTEFWPKRR